MSDFDPVPPVTVPLADSALNTTSAEVLGNKLDTIAGDSIVALVKQLRGGPVVTYPVLAAGATLTAGAADTYGAAVELAAAGVITSDALLASACIRTPSAAQTGKLQIGYGAGPTYICEVDYEVASDVGAFFSVPLCGQGGVIPSGSAISARIKTTAGAQTVDASVGFTLLA